MKKKNIVSLLFFVIILSVGSYALFHKTNAPLEIVAAKRGEAIEKVSVTGYVKPVLEVDLAFEKTGKVSKVLVQVGDKVSLGQVLVALESNDLQAEKAKATAGLQSAEAQLEQYKAALEQEQIKLQELQKGTRAEEMQVAATKVSNAEKSLSDAKLNLENVKTKADSDLNNLYDGLNDVLQDAYTKADDAVNKQTDELFSSDTSLNPLLTFITTDSQAKNDVEFLRVKVGTMLQVFKRRVESLGSSFDLLDKALKDTAEDLISVRSFLVRLQEALNSAASLSQATTTVYKGYITTARTNLNSALSNITSEQESIKALKTTNQNSITSAQTKVNEAESALLNAQDDLALKKAGTRKEQVVAQEAQVRQASANLALGKAGVAEAYAAIAGLEVQISKTELYSPLNGLVTKQEAKVGEIIASNSLVVSIISQDLLKIQADIPEADIAKVSIGNSAEVTLDAYGNEVVFKARVITISPASTLIEGVATYETTFEFLNGDQRIFPGLTANIDILTQERKNVIIIPQRALISKNGDKIVKVLEPNGTVKEVLIKVGLRGLGGNLEILSGIEEGDKVVVPQLD